MSMIRCDACGRLIDSDDDPDCFIDTSPNEEDYDLDDDRDSRAYRASIMPPAMWAA